MLFGAVLALRLLYPLLDSPLTHLYSDPLRHWDNGLNFLHPSVMGSGDPYMYQLWLFLLQRLSGHSGAVLLAACSLLCAAMPYGWYRALRELIPRERALASACVMGLWPSFLGPYAYFMTETLLLTLSGFAFWLTLRALRKRTLGAFAAACVLWTLTGFTRIVMLPMAALCLLCAWLGQPRMLRALLIGLLPMIAVAIPAGLHTRSALGYFSPFGNVYLNEIYHAGNNKSIQIDFGAQGVYIFGSPSYYNPTFYPFSDWTSSRTGTLSIAIDTRHGREDWRRVLEDVRARSGARGRNFAENMSYLFFGQAWPDNDRGTLVGALEVWMRWLVLPMVVWTAAACVRGVYRGREWLLPACALLGLVLLAVQREGIMEGRYRKPVEPVFLAAIALSLNARARAADRR